MIFFAFLAQTLRMGTADEPMKTTPSRTSGLASIEPSVLKVQIGLPSARLIA